MNRRISALLAMVAATLLVAGTASAQATFSMSGKAGTGSGPDVRLPAIGPAACASITGDQATPTMIPQKATAPWTQLSTVLNANGCIPAAAVDVMTNGTGGFMFPAMFFNAPVTGMLRVVPVPKTPMVVQLATSFGFTGPNMTNAPFEVRNAQKYNMATAPYAVWNNFRHGAWTTHTGRVGSNFTACATMVAGNVSCTFPSQGMIPGIVKNIGGGSGGFGGTMGLVLTTGTTNQSSLGITIGGGRILINYLAGMGSRAAGRGYAAFDTDNLIGGNIWNMFMLTNMTTSMNAVIGTVMTFLAPGGAGINNNYGWPWTTGTIIVRGTGASVQGQPMGGTFSIQGYDNRTAMGAGNIQLVAGHIAQASIQGPNGTANYSVMRLPEPGSALPLVAGAVALLGLAAWRVRRNR